MLDWSKGLCQEYPLEQYLSGAVMACVLVAARFYASKAYFFPSDLPDLVGRAADHRSKEVDNLKGISEPLHIDAQRCRMMKVLQFLIFSIQA